MLLPRAGHKVPITHLYTKSPFCGFLEGASTCFLSESEANGVTLSVPAALSRVYSDNPCFAARSRMLRSTESSA